MKFISNQKNGSAFVFLLFFLVFTACKNESGDLSADRPLNVTTTTGMIADAVVNIGKEKVKVTALMGPGVDPHLYKASQSDLQILRGADIIFYNGLKLEGKMESLFSRLKETQAVYCISDGIENGKFLSSNEYANTFDPHIWFDVALWSETAVNISRALQDVDPENAAYYESNAKTYVATLHNLHEEIKLAIAEIPEQNRILITTHDAFHYFSRAYNIRVEALQGISTATEIGLKDVTRVVDIIVETGVPAVFVESSVSSKSLKAVIEGCQNRNKHNVEIGGTLFADAMGADGTAEGTYVGMVRYNVDAIRQALLPKE